MTLGVACLLKHVFSDCFNAEKNQLKEVRSQNKNKSVHQFIAGYVGACYTSIVLGDHPVPVKLQSYLSFIESVREGITKRKLADDFFKRSRFYCFANRRSVK